VGDRIQQVKTAMRTACKRVGLEGYNLSYASSHLCVVVNAGARCTSTQYQRPAGSPQHYHDRSLHAQWSGRYSRCSREVGANSVTIWSHWPLSY